MLFGAGMGFQGGSPGKVDVMYVSLVQTSDPGPKTQNSEVRSEEESFKVQRSTLNVEEIESAIEEKSSRDTVDELTGDNMQPTISNFQFPISNSKTRNSEFRIQNSEFKVQNPEPVAITAYAGDRLPAGILSQGSEGKAGLIYFPPVATTLPRPPYPLSSRRKGEEGTVTLSFLIYSDGTVGEILVVQSSGYPRLDKAASRSLRSAVFQSASQSGLLVTSNRKIAFSFRLED